MKRRFKIIYCSIRIKLLKRKIIRHDLRYLKIYAHCIVKIGNPKNENQREALKCIFREYDKTLNNLTKEIDTYRGYL